ncbi:hypothetical protein [Bacillus suaedaesalsae]|uniref:Uncharacterized protein n=1 Tax=Bacillus suaedaesalsae TaxID=2810349 RepID=A0ABS2DLQ8_9BACI|nr:hypothetical protein [Bacillus suaedaesalsae]MBM6618990.1 hypothetical protein [Bacillus suaedaesalsae]
MKNLTVLSLFMSLLFVNSSAFASTDLSKQECTRKVELKMAEFQHQVMEDVFASYNEHYDLTHRLEAVSFHDLSKFKRLHTEKEPDIESLTPFFTGASIGEKKLFLNEANRATMFFKDLEGNNHRLTLKKSKSGWEQLNEEVKAGTKMEYKKLKCEEEHQMQQFLNGLFKRKE